MGSPPNQRSGLLQGLAVFVTVLVVATTVGLWLTGALDAPPPRLFVESPEDGALVTTSQLQVRGACWNVPKARVRVHDQVVEADARGRFQAAVELPNGDVDLVIAVLAEGSETPILSEVRRVLVDTIAPTIRLHDLATTTSSRDFEVSGDVDDPQAQLTINDELTAISGLRFSKLVELEEGTNRIRLSVRDAAGNTRRIDHVVERRATRNAPPREVDELTQSIANAARGASLVPRATRFEGNYEILQPLTIEAAIDEPVTIVAKAGAAFVVRADARFVRLQIATENAAPSSSAAAIIVESGTLELVGCAIRSRGLGITVGPKGRLRLRDCRVESCLAGGVLALEGASVEVDGGEFRTNGVADVTLRGATGQIASTRFSKGAMHSVYARERATLTMTDCTVESYVKTGVVVANSSRGRLERCVVRDNRQVAAIAMFGSSLQATRCRFASTDYSGMEVHSQSQAELTSCEFEGNQLWGLLVRKSAKARATGCEFVNNGKQGAEVRDASEAQFEGCKFRKNRGFGLLRIGEAAVTVSGCAYEDNVAGSTNVVP